MRENRTYGARGGRRRQRRALPYQPQADPEWAAALHLLTGRALRGKGGLLAVDFARRETDFPGLAERATPWSHAEHILLCAAWCLFNDRDRAVVASLLGVQIVAEAGSTLVPLSPRTPKRRFVAAATPGMTDDGYDDEAKP